MRLDGPGCWRAVAKVWRPENTPEVTEEKPPEPRRLCLGILRDAEGRRLDEALLAWFPAPRSYTGNDLAEFQCHGSPAVVAAAVEALQAVGARMARPGEFTERAFFNGRLDLAQAEGVANLIAARTRQAGRLALAQLRGTLSREIETTRDRLIDLGAEIEARLDFPEEEIEPADFNRMAAVFDEASGRLDRLVASARRGRLFRDGARVVIAGRPNTGKSSLFNALVGMERALVTPHAGTTRDTIEATLDIRGIPVVLVDTAGVRNEGAEEIERLGVERALREVEEADLTLFVLDGSTKPTPEDRRVLEKIGDNPSLTVINKCDLEPVIDAKILKAEFKKFAENSSQAPALRVSAHDGETLGALEQALEARLLGQKETESLEGGVESAAVTNQRHEERLRAALSALDRARQAFAQGASGEFTMIDLNEALEALGEIVGLSLDDAILSRVFSRFCIGK